MRPVPTVTAEPVILADGLESVHYSVVERPQPCRVACWITGLIVGELRNATDLTLDTPALTFSLLDDDGNTLGAVAAVSLVPVIGPEQLVPFEGTLTEDQPRVGEWARKEVELADQWGTELDVARFGTEGLDLRDVHETDHAATRFRVEGAVINGSGTPVKGIKVFAAVYGPDGHYAGSIMTFELLDVTIPPSKTAAFFIDSGYAAFDPVGLAGPDYSFRLIIGR